MKLRSIESLTLASILFLAGAPTLLAQGGQLSGAIFTTLGDGSAVNENQFSSKCSVYLDGGPGPNAPAKAAGLPDGLYYFQVTDPSGAQLLSTDPVRNRQFEVKNGVIVAYASSGGPVHPVGVDRDHQELGAITIRLANADCPNDFLDTSNSGGTYKVWITPVDVFLGDPALVDNPCSKGCFHGFRPSLSKTDNFKTRPQSPTFCLVMQKQLQVQTPDGVTYNPAESWPMTVTDPLLSQNLYHTDATGQTKVCGLTDGAYTVSEQSDPPPPACPLGSDVVGLVVNGVAILPQQIYSFTWSSKTGPGTVTVLFRNVCAGIG